jgi:DNA-binding CsgD family transcriptional regulator/PAS domain-containing protein
MNADFKAAYDGVAHLDPFLIRARARGLFEAGLVGVGDALVPEAELKRTEFYSAFGRRFDYVGGLAGVIAANPKTFAAIGIARSPNQPFGREQVDLMRTLMPHLQRAWQLHQRLAEAEGQQRSFADTLSRLTVGVIIVDARGIVVFANESARTLFATGDGLVVNRGLLRGASAQDTSALNALIAAALNTASLSGLDAGGVVQLRRPSGSRALRVIVSPLPANDRVAISEPRALLFVTDPEDAPQPDADVMRQAFNLTPAEVEIAGLLMQDKTTREISEWLGVTIHTVRFHMKQLFAKTGTTRQGSLLRLLSVTAQIRRPKKH